MRILQVVPLLAADGSFGGPARVALNQCAELLRRGHDVTLVAGAQGYDTSLTEVDGVPVRLFGVRNLMPRSGFPGLASPGLARWGRAYAGEFDVVHIHFGRHLTVLPVAAAVRRRHIPYVLQTHGMVIPSAHPLAGPLDAIWTRRLLTGAAAVLYLTGTERELLRDVAGGPVNLVELGNGVPEYRPGIPRPGPPEVLFLARLEARKRPVLFVQMAHRLLAEGIQARFTLIGPDEGQGAAARAAIGEEPRIRWEGPISPAQVLARMAEARVYVLPAEREPYPMAVLEAMSAGLPVVVCDDCGLAPMIAQTGSGVVAEGTLAALADAVKTVLVERDSCARRAHSTAIEHFSMTAVGDRLETIYRQAVTR
jgi:glycosyltransferase involved in cell wall biosynthesis